jgi:hypothetical protein
MHHFHVAVGIWPHGYLFHFRNLRSYTLHQPSTLIIQNIMRYRVGIAAGQGLDDWSSIPGGGGLGIFLFATASRPVLGPTQPPIQWVSGALSLGVKRPGREADHSPPSSAEVKE